MLSLMDVGMQALLMLGAAALAWAYVRAARPEPVKVAPTPVPEPEPESIQPESSAELASLMPPLSPEEQDAADQEQTFLMTDQAALQALILETEERRRERFGGPVQVDDEPLEQPE